MNRLTTELSKLEILPNIPTGDSIKEMISDFPKKAQVFTDAVNRGEGKLPLFSAMEQMLKEFLNLIKVASVTYCELQTIKLVPEILKEDSKSEIKQQTMAILKFDKILKDLLKNKNIDGSKK